MDRIETAKAPACERCYRRKSRCDKEQPACSSCSKASAPCNYNWRSHAAGNKRELAALAQRLRQSEARNAALSRELESLRNCLPVEPLGSSAISPQVPCSASPAQDRSPDHNKDKKCEPSPPEYLITPPRSLCEAGQSWGSQSASILCALIQEGDGSPATRDADTDAEPVSIMPRRFRRAAASTLSRSRELKALLPRDSAASLVEAYLSHHYLLFPFLQPESLQKSLDALYGGEEPLSLDPHQGFILDMVLALGTVRVKHLDWHGLPDAETYYERASGGLERAVRSGGIIALQAILLTCQYRLRSPPRDASVGLWHLVGTAARLCLEMGLHQESGYTQTDDEDTKVANEIRRRCFWSVVAFDRIISIMVGKPPAIHQDDIAADLPLTSGGEVFLLDKPIDLADSICCERLWHSTRWFVNQIRYRLICGQIFSLLHKPTTRYGYQQEIDRTSVRAYLEEELIDWHRSAQLLPLRPSISVSVNEIGASSLASPGWYDLLYHTAVLMLYRPVHARQDSLPSGNSLQRLYDSSTQCIKIYSELHRTRKLNYSWLSLNAIHIAGLSYLYALRLHFKLRQRPSLPVQNETSADRINCLSSDPSIVDIVSTSRACSILLVAMCERWSSAWNRHLAFDKLNDIVLKEIVEPPQQASSPDDATASLAFEFEPDSLVGLSYSQHSDVLETPTSDFLQAYEWCFEAFPDNPGEFSTHS